MMKRSLTILALAALAALASAQSSGTPTTVYAEAKREQHKKPTNGFTNDTGAAHDYSLTLSQGNFFRITGDADTADATGQSIPWGMTWRNLCDNEWTFTKTVQVHLDPDWGFIQIDDWYTIDKACGAETPNDPDDDDPSNGDDIIVEGTKTWIRTCTSLVTNDITYKISPPYVENPAGSGD